MRRLFLASAIAAVATLGAVNAQAGALESAEFRISIGTLGPLVFAGNGSSAGTAISSTSATLAAGNALAAMSTIVLTKDKAPPLTKIGVTITKNDLIKASGTPDLAGIGAVRGKSINYAFNNPLLVVPVAAGLSDTSTIMGSVFNVKVQAKKWTSGMTTITGLDEDATFMATGAVNPGTPGAITLVAVAKITVTGAVSTITYTFSELELNFASVPEPALPVMMVAGAATLALVGGRKLRRS
jgi:hypothetical protein